MMEKEYRKSWKGLGVWVVLFLTVAFALPFIPGAGAALASRIVILTTLWWCFALMAWIWLTEQIYWINGVTFEQARDAGSHRRKAFAWAHVKHFGWAALIGTAVTLLAYLCGWAIWIDMTISIAAMIAAAVSSIGIKL